MICPHCGAESAPDSTFFCPKCGTSFTREDSVACPHCGARNVPGDAFCTACGQALATTAPAKKARLVLWGMGGVAVVVVALICLASAAGAMVYARGGFGGGTKASPTSASVAAIALTDQPAVIATATATPATGQAVTATATMITGQSVPTATEASGATLPASTPVAPPTVRVPDTATAVRAAPTSTAVPAIATPPPPVPTAAPKTPTAPSTTAVTWATHADEDKSFKYPAGWTPENIQSGIRYRLDADGNVTRASIYARQAYRLGTSFYPSTGVERKSTTAVDYLNVFLDSWLTSQTFTTYDPRQTETINGNPAIIQRYTQVHGGRDVQGLGNTKGIAVVIQKGDYAYFVNMFTREQWLATYDPIFQEALRSFTPKKG